MDKVKGSLIGSTLQQFIHPEQALFNRSIGNHPVPAFSDWVYLEF